MSQNDLLSCALDSGSADAQAHLEDCETCRIEVESYRSTLTGIRTVFSSPAPRVHVFQCEHGLMSEDHTCTVEHPATGDRLDITCHAGWLSGRLTHVDDRNSDKTATAVRLFSQQGLVSSVPVDENGTFLVRCMNADQRHSVTIVLPADGTALQLLSNSE
ncbi:MAG: hypothetical protein R2844_17685 [Caldilineales bacterium]